MTNGEQRGVISLVRISEKVFGITLRLVVLLVAPEPQRAKRMSRWIWREIYFILNLKWCDHTSAFYAPRANRQDKWNIWLPAKINSHFSQMAGDVQPSQTNIFDGGNLWIEFDEKFLRNSMKKFERATALAMPLLIRANIMANIKFRCRVNIARCFSCDFLAAPHVTYWLRRTHFNTSLV